MIKEQNMLDVFVSVEGYCNLLLERIFLLEQERLNFFSPSLLFLYVNMYTYSIIFFIHCGYRSSDGF